MFPAAEWSSKLQGDDYIFKSNQTNQTNQHSIVRIYYWSDYVTVGISLSIAYLNNISRVADPVNFKVGSGSSLRSGPDPV